MSQNSTTLTASKYSLPFCVLVDPAKAERYCWMIAVATNGVKNMAAIKIVHVFKNKYVYFANFEYGWSHAQPRRSMSSCYPDTLAQCNMYKEIRSSSKIMKK